MDLGMLESKIAVYISMMYRLSLYWSLVFSVIVSEVKQLFFLNIIEHIEAN